MGAWATESPQLPWKKLDTNVIIVVKRLLPVGVLQVMQRESTIGMIIQKDHNQRR